MLKITVQTMKLAFSRTNRNLQPFLRFNLLFISIFLLTNYLSAIVAMQASYRRTEQVYIYTALVLAAGAFFNGGLFYYYLCNLRGVTNTAAQVFRGYKWYFKILGFYLGAFGLYLVFFHRFWYLNDYDLRAKTAFILGAVFSLYFFIRFIFVIPFFIDEDAGFFEAFQKSRRLTRGNFFLTSATLFLAVLFLSISIVLFGVTALYGVSIFSLMYLILFDYLKKGQFVTGFSDESEK